MSRYQEFCESLWVGMTKAAEQQLTQEDRDRQLPHTVAQIVQRMCDSFQCPVGRVHYVDDQANIVTGTAEAKLPVFGHDPEKARSYLDIEIEIGELSGQVYPVRLHLEFVPLKHGGLEFHFGSHGFQIPHEERLFFDCVAEAINRELRQGFTPALRKIGF